MKPKTYEKVIWIIEFGAIYLLGLKGSILVHSECTFPVDTRTKNVRTKDVHKRTFIFGSIWKHGKTS